MNGKLMGHPRLSNFRSLQTLRLKASSWIEDGLDKLTNLRKFGINGDVSSHHKALSNAIEKWCNLRSLSLRNSSSIPPFVSFAHYLNLCKMFLHGRIKNLPKKPPNLAKLTLIGSQLQQDAIETLEKLRNPRVLRLEQEPYCSEKMICSSGGFPRLEFLVLDSSNLKEWIVEEGGFPCLEFLELNCSNIKEWIVEEGGFPRLEVLELDYSNIKEWVAEKGALKSLKKVMLGPHAHLKTHPKQIVHLLE
ncbi:Disease resistance protein [Cinnamomum micranthum f. kanehirae]|uniref:Disease resistance protein n=1 Tax=Cinnamomum micranthum f. kanehirae TaxID=337451 RepID=A0A443NEH6_9MAGN|nr:Disease resistance protein [Cinnamomum micranthum f. kanehirae]